MRVDNHSRAPRSGWHWALLLGGALGVAVGMWIAQASADAPQGPSATTSGVTTSGATPPAAGDKDPTTFTGEDLTEPDNYRQLEVTFEPEHWARIVAHRERSLANNAITRDDDATVPVEVHIGNDRATGTARLKGDLTDHITSDQWSLRFELETPLLGMRRFSIQHPGTRGFVMEWLVMQTARKLDLLAPRSEFVQARVNGGDARLYYLEEHPTKEMLESQGRRDGPVVKFDEAAMWDIWRQFDQFTQGHVPPAMHRAEFVMDAPAIAFSEARLRRVQTLNDRLARALEQMRAARSLIAGSDLPADQLRRLVELQRLEGRTVEDLFDTERLGKWLALHTIYRGFHGLIWHQLRFYHDPLTDRLEPMVFDTGAEFLKPNEQLALDSRFARWYRTSPRVTLAAFEELHRMTAPGWAEGVLAAAMPRILQVKETVRQQPSDMPPEQVESFANLLFDKHANMLLGHRDFVRKMITPDAAAAFSATSFTVRDPNGGEPIPMVEVEAWSRTTMPVTIDQFAFGNGRVIPAAPTQQPLVDTQDDAVWQLTDSRVLLPRHGAPLRFRFPADERLLGLDQIRAIKRAIRDGAVGSSKKLPSIDVRYRVAGAPKPRQHRLLMRQGTHDNAAVAGRPKPPTLAEAIARHPFLAYDVQRDRLSIPAGEHRVDGDLLLPDHHTLHLEAGAVLRMAPDRVMVAGALQANGTEEQPVRIEAPSADAPFAGLLVLGTAGPSDVAHLHVRAANQIARDAWQTTGGVTFVGAEVRLRNCRFLDAAGEDALNVVRVRLTLENCTFAGGKSDLFDGDFTHGTVTGCTFRDGEADALDVSGSHLEVRDCHFERIGDKALSVGEGSEVQASDCHVHSAMIAASSKDRSKVTIRGLTVDTVERFVAVAYIKKPEFGAADLRIDGLTWNGNGPPQYLAQTNCELLIDGQAVATQDLDVKALYRDQILGK